MSNTPTSFLKRAVASYMTDHDAKRKYSAKEYEAVLTDVFKMLSEKVMDGYIIRPPFNLGEFSMKVIHDYKVSKKNGSVQRRALTNRYFKDYYFVNFSAGKHKCMIYYTFSMSREMRSKICDRLKEGGKIFAFEKERTR